MTEWGADAATYADAAAFVPALGMPVLDLLDPRPGERIVDLGCGDGALTVELVARGAQVVALDADPTMVAAATARGLDSRLADGASFTSALVGEAPFDAVFSNAALHWMPDASRVVGEVHACLRPDGRFVAEFGGFGNVAAVASAARAVLTPLGRSVPRWYFPRPDAYTGLLEDAGFEVASTELIHRPTPLPAGMDAWLTTFLATALDGLAPGERDEVVTSIAASLEPSLRDDRGEWWADYVRLRVSARRR